MRSRSHCTTRAAPRGSGAALRCENERAHVRRFDLAERARLSPELRRNLERRARSPRSDSHLTGALASKRNGRRNSLTSARGACPPPRNGPVTAARDQTPMRSIDGCGNRALFGDRQPASTAGRVARGVWCVRAAGAPRFRAWPRATGSSQKPTSSAHRPQRLGPVGRHEVKRRTFGVFGALVRCPLLGVNVLGDGRANARSELVGP